MHGSRGTDLEVALISRSKRSTVAAILRLTRPCHEIGSVSDFIRSLLRDDTVGGIEACCITYLDIVAVVTTSLAC